MPVRIALLRGINVGGKNRVAMSDLRAMCAALGLADARTLLQSGNLVFSDRRGAPALEKLLENETSKRLGLDVDYAVRTVEQWDAVVAGNPLVREAERDPSHLLVVFLKSEPTAAAVRALEAAITGRELVRARGRELYVWYPVDIATSKLTTAVLDRKLAVRGTARNWSTVLKIAELARA